MSSNTDSKLAENQETKPQTKILIRLRRVSGQIQGIERMIQNEQSCVDILNQIMAARSGLAKVASKLLAQESCKLNVTKDTQQLEEIINKLIKLQ